MNNIHVTAKAAELDGSLNDHHGKTYHVCGLSIQIHGGKHYRWSGAYFTDIQWFSAEMWA